MPAVPNQPQGQPDRRVYTGILFDDFTPQVESQIMRDVQQLRQVAARSEEIVVCCSSNKPQKMLDQLQVRIVPTLQLATMWIIYRTKEYWPDTPEWCTTEVRRDLYQGNTGPNLMRTDPDQQNGFYLPPQGRLSPDTLSLERPAPNGYICVDPGLIQVWSSATTARLKGSK